jgi:predicted nucleic acid-binding protein
VQPAWSPTVVDTSVLIAHLRGDGRVSRALRDALLEDRPWFVSSVSHHEVYRAARQSELGELDRLFASLWTVPVTAAVAREAARIWAELRQDGFVIDVPDQLIAATARIHGLSVTTLNPRHFGWVRGLPVRSPTGG